MGQKAKIPVGEQAEHIWIHPFQAVNLAALFYAPSKSPGVDQGQRQGNIVTSNLPGAGRGVCRQIFQICIAVSCLLSRSIFQILFEFVCNHAELFNRVIYLIQIPQLTHFLGNAPDSVRVGF